MVKLFIFLFSFSCFANSTLTNVKVSGEKEASLQFEGAGNEPSWKIRSNVLELTFLDTLLDENTEGKIDISSPHPLIKRVSAFQLEKDVVRVNIVMNGSVEEMKERVTFDKSSKGVSMRCAYPKGDTSLLDSLKEDEIPLTQAVKESNKKSEKGAGVTIAVTAVSLLLFVFIGFYSIKFLKSKGGIRGTRKYLIEQMGYCPLGPKMGVSLIKIGEEFVLLGVTPGNISMLSALPKLRDQYMEETKFERNVFKEAVEEEFNRMKV